MTSVADRVRNAVRVIIPDTSADARIAKIAREIETLEAEHLSVLEAYELATMRESRGAITTGGRRPSHDLADRLREIKIEISSLENQRRLLVGQIREASRAEILGSREYHSIVRASWERWREQLAPHLALAEVHEAAQRTGITLPAIPQPLGLQVVAFHAWTKELIQRGILTQEDTNVG